MNGIALTILPLRLAFIFPATRRANVINSIWISRKPTSKISAGQARCYSLSKARGIKVSYLLFDRRFIFSVP